MPPEGASLACHPSAPPTQLAATEPVLGGTVFPGPPPGPLGAAAMTLLAEGNPAAALDLLDRALADGDAAPATALSWAVAADRTGRREAARARLQTLLEHHRGWDEPALRLAESLRAAGDISAAEAAYGRALDANPHRGEALLGLATLLLPVAPDRALPCLRRFSALAPRHAEGWALLGGALSLVGDHAAAEAALAEACRLEPEEIAHALQRVMAAYHAGRGEAELARLERATEDDPLDIVALAARAYMLEWLHRRPEAIDLLDVATALAPNSAMIAGTLGGLLARAYRLPEAEAALRRAAALAPNNSHVRADLGTVMIRQHRHVEGRAELEAVIAEFGANQRLLANLALAVVSLGEQDQAAAIAHDAIALAPDNPGPWRTLCNTVPYCQDITGAAMLQTSQDASARLQRVPAMGFANTPDPDRRLRLGLLSGTLRTHPVGWLTVAGFEHLDPASFDLVALTQAGGECSIAARYRRICSAWHETDRLDDPALARLIRELGIDVLIDLGGYGDAGRMPVCALRPAPVQIKWVGMQNHSTGLPEMDWIIADRWQIPPALEHVYSERPLRLDDGYVCYSPPAYAPDVGPLPALANGHITFGCFNNLAKVTPRTIAAWSMILHRVPTARMMVKCQQLGVAATRDRVLAAFGAHGIDAARLELRGPSKHRAFMAEYNDVDIVLDPFPYSGGLTTCEALWMGVPTIMLPGETFAARHSLSHMGNAGLTGWDAGDVAGYVELAVRRAADVDALAELRRGLRARVQASPLCDAPRFGRSLGRALRHAWQDWCTQR